MNLQTLYQNAIRFAASKHEKMKQTVPGTDLPYVVHLSNVAMEILVASQYSKDFDVNFSVQVALLHDTVEDTSTTLAELSKEFNAGIANAVSALTKNNQLESNQKMFDSLRRIKMLPKEVWAVKLADRITNLQKPPANWTENKKKKYLEEAKLILESLKGGNQYLENRLEVKIKDYAQYIRTNQ